MLMYRHFARATENIILQENVDAEKNRCGEIRYAGTLGVVVSSAVQLTYNLYREVDLIAG